MKGSDEDLTFKDRGQGMAESSTQIPANAKYGAIKMLYVNDVPVYVCASCVYLKVFVYFVSFQ